MAEATEPIPHSNLAEQADMKTIIGGIDLGFTTFMNSYYNAMAAGVEDLRNSQRRINAMADQQVGLVMNDARSIAAAQNGMLVGATGARQDTLATTETEQSLANVAQQQARLAEDLARFTSVLNSQQERTAQLENTMSTALAAIVAKLDAITESSTPVGPST